MSEHDEDPFATVRDVPVRPLRDRADVVRRGRRRRTARTTGRAGLLLGAVVVVVAVAAPVLRPVGLEPIGPAPLPSPSVPPVELLRGFEGTSPVEESLLDDGVTRDELRASAEAVVACAQHHGWGTGGRVAYDTLARSYVITSGPSLNRALEISFDDCIAWFHDDVAEAWSDQLPVRTPAEQQALADQLVRCLERTSGVPYAGPTELDHVVRYLLVETSGPDGAAQLDALEHCSREP